MEIKTLLSNKSNYGSTRSVSTIKYLVLHYTGNKTDKAISNAKYFKNNNVGASAHYFVDKTEIYQSVPDNCIAWHCGGNKYPSCATSGGGKMYNIVTNKNSIGVELCSDNGQFHKDTLDNAEELVKYLMQKYNIPATNICRHFDVTGKSCPLYWIKGTGFEDFKKRLTKEKKDNELIKAVDDITKSGIKINANQWNDVTKIKLQYVPALLTKLGGLDKLVEDKIISDTTLWKQKKYNVNHVRSLIIKYSKTL